MKLRGIVSGFLCWVFCNAILAQETSPLPPAAAGSIVAKIADDVAAVEGVISNQWVMDWLKTAKGLAAIQPTKVSLNGKEVSVDESLYYMRYGSPLAYARALDLAITAGFEATPNSRVFDFGYGSIGHLRMLALSGIHSVGVDVAPLLKLMYAEASGKLGTGSVHVLDGPFPRDFNLVEKVGFDYDMVISKNVLKRGYIHPQREVSNPRLLIDLGVSDLQFLEHMAKILKPQGLFVIYNFCPAKATNDQAYIPWADGESPFTKQDFISAGFEVLHFDVVDHAEARRLGQALGWDTQGGMKLDTDLFAWYTIARKRRDTEVAKP
ncbi:MAG: hypothetical protein ABL921_12515 [Pirellula sp.]